MRYLKKKFSWFAIVTLLLSLSTLSLYAKDDPGFPGGGCDPFETDPNAADYCDPNAAPLDTWVFLLVFMVLALTLWYWYKQKKSLRTL